MNKKNAKLIILYEMRYLDIDIDKEYKRLIEDIVTKEFTKEQKIQLLEYYGWCRGWIHYTCDGENWYDVDGAFNILKKNLKE